MRLRDGTIPTDLQIIVENLSDKTLVTVYAEDEGLSAQTRFTTLQILDKDADTLVGEISLTLNIAELVSEPASPYFATELASI